MTRGSLVVVANRLPVDEQIAPDGQQIWRRSPGGLVSALHPVLREAESTWIGWAGGIDSNPSVPDTEGVRMRSVALTAEDFAGYYEGFSNSTLWPLYHDAVEQPIYHRRWWEAYKRVNRRFAEVTAEVAEPDSVVWVQDYHLQLVPAMVRALRSDVRIGFFLHIPFPPAELFMQLPRRAELLHGLLGADLVGFQGAYGAQNFTRLAARLLGVRTRRNEIQIDGRTVRTGAFPISIDVVEMEHLARREDVIDQAAKIRADLGEPERIILGVDRLDYTKGIEQRLKAYRELLSAGQVVVPETVMVQVAVPTRETAEHYRILRDRVEAAVGGINGEYGRVGVPAVHYLSQSFEPAELAALYRAADVLTVTPLRDGMNLVAKEYVAARVDGGGALVLSEFTGAAAQLRDAYLVNPHDLDGLKAAMMRALTAPTADARRRMRGMRRHLRANDIRHWADSYLTALGRPT
ncbi:MAG: alpha,alpha-trehalose-phosphate synthase (UDP-forming) [Micromonosporaceae bacterium]